MCSNGLYAQTVTTVVDVGGSGNSSELCDFDVTNDPNGSYDCKDSPSFGDDWNSGNTYTFEDPIPAGSVITGIDITMHNASCDASGNIEIEGSMIMFMLDGTTCFPNSPCQDVEASSIFSDGLLPSEYNYGGTNMFDLAVQDGIGNGGICFTHASITFTYEAAPEPIPTMGEWSVIVLGILLLIVSVVVIGSRRVVGA